MIDTIITLFIGIWLGASFGMVIAALLRGNDNEDVFTE
jgi:hypothetical protein